MHLFENLSDDLLLRKQRDVTSAGGSQLQDMEATSAWRLEAAKMDRRPLDFSHASEAFRLIGEVLAERNSQKNQKSKKLKKPKESASVTASSDAAGATAAQTPLLSAAHSPPPSR